MALQDAATPDFFRDPNVVGTATGLDAGGAPAILVFVVDESEAAAVPSTIDGVPWLCRQRAVSSPAKAPAVARAIAQFKHLRFSWERREVGVSTSRTVYCCGGTLGR
jgi:hypothetical protein